MIFDLDISDEQGWALAELFKRMGYSDFRDKSKNEEEAEAMAQAVSKMRSAFCSLGFEPR